MTEMTTDHMMAALFGPVREPEYNDQRELIRFRLSPQAAASVHQHRRRSFWEYQQDRED